MKKLITSFLLLLSLNTFSQDPPIDPETKKFTYKDAIQVDTLSKSTLFNRENKWFETKYKTQKFELKDETDGKIVNKGNFPVSYKVGGSIQEFTIIYTATVIVKDGKYKYELTDFIFSQNQGGTARMMTLESYKEYKVVGVFNSTLQKKKVEVFSQVDAECKKIIEEIKSYMNGTQKQNDW